MEWSTKTIAADRPFGSWAEDLADAFVRLEPRKIAEQPFQGTISRADVASIQISRVEATKHVVHRLRSHIARSISDVYFVNLQLDGVGRYTQRGHEQICGPGDLAVVDTTEPFEIANCRNFSLFCFAVPRQLLPNALAERPRLRLSATEAGRALSRTLAGHADLCLRSAPNSGISGFGAQHVVDLISHAPGILEERPAERAGRSVLLSMMRGANFRDASAFCGRLPRRQARHATGKWRLPLDPDRRRSQKNESDWPIRIDLLESE